MLIAGMAARTTTRTNLVTSGQLIINIIAPADIHVSDVDIYEVNNNMLIEGKVENRFPYNNKDKGYIDIEIADSHGAMLKKLTTDYKFTTVGYRRSGSRGRFFKKRFALVPPRGSNVRIMFYN